MNVEYFREECYQLECIIIEKNKKIAELEDEVECYKRNIRIKNTVMEKWQKIIQKYAPHYTGATDIIMWGIHNEQKIR